MVAEKMKIPSLKTISMYMKNIKADYPFLESIGISYNSERDYFVVTVFYKSGKNVSFFDVEEAEKRLEKLNILFRKFNKVKKNNNILKRKFK